MSKDPDCPGCADCGLPLCDSVYTADATLKSCALCSRIAGEHVYHDLADFGAWHRADGPGKLPYLQSECSAVTWQRRKLEQSSFTTRSLDEIRRAIPAPKLGRSCSELGRAGRMLEHAPQYATRAEVASILRPLREAAKRILDASAEIYASQRFAKDEYSFDRPLAEQVAEDRPAPDPRPTVLRRKRGGQAASAHAGAA